MVKNNKFIVYAHIAPNGKTYVGITSHKNPNRRWQNGQGYRKQKKFYNAILKYGWDNFEHVIIARDLPQSLACEFERKLIVHYNSIENGYNVDAGGSVTNLGIKWSEDIKRKMGAPKRGKKASDLTRAKMSNARKGKAVYGSRKPVVQLDCAGNVLNIFDSAKTAGEKLGIKPGHITEVCRGNKSRKKSVRYYNFEYYKGGGSNENSKQ